VNRKISTFIVTFFVDAVDYCHREIYVPKHLCIWNGYLPTDKINTQHNQQLHQELIPNVCKKVILLR